MRPSSPTAPVARPALTPVLPSVRELTALTLPQMGLMACHVCISLTDLWVAGQIDAAALSALGVVSQIFSLLLLLTSLAGSGCLATVSQSLGGGRIVRAQRYAALVLACCFALGWTVALAGLAALPLLLKLLTQDPVLRQTAHIFAVAYCCHMPFFFCMVIMNSLFRAHKLVWLPLATLLLVALVNYAGSAGFGLGWWGLPRLGYAGVAWATTASGVAGFVCNAVLVWRWKIVGRAPLPSSPHPLLPWRWAHLLPRWRWTRLALPRLWRIGIPAALGSMAGQAGSLVLLACLSSLPTAVSAVAGMTLGQRILGVPLFASAALSMTLTICSGHLLGARQGEACYRLGLRLAAVAAAGLTVGGVLLYACHGQVAQWFSGDVAARHEAGVFLAFGCLLLPLQGAAQMLCAVFHGAGKTRLGTWSSCTGTWLVAVPLAYALGHGMRLGATGVYAAMTLGHAVTALLAYFFYRRRQWLA